MKHNKTLTLNIDQYILPDGLCLQTNILYFHINTEDVQETRFELRIGDYTYQLDESGKILETLKKD